MKRKNINAHVYAAASSARALDKDPRDAVFVEVLDGDPPEEHGVDMSGWVRVNDDSGSRCLLYRHWARLGSDGCIYLKCRYVIETQADTRLRIESHDRERAARKQRYDLLDGLSARLDSTGLVKSAFVGRNEVKDGVVRVSISLEHIEEVIARLSCEMR